MLSEGNKVLSDTTNLQIHTCYTSTIVKGLYEFKKFASQFKEQKDQNKMNIYDNNQIKIIQLINTLE